MIEINLLPGDAKKKKRGKATTGSGFKMEIHPAQWFAGLSDKITDKYMLGAVGAAAASGALIVLLFISQTARGAMLEARENQAVKDSAQYSALLNAKARAEATRDSLYQQISIIKSIDDSRYLWSHLMYEISNALPQYTWLTEVSQTSPPKSVAMADTVVKKGAAANADTAGQGAKSPRQRQLEKDRIKKARADSLLADARTIKFKIVGHTVDIQALTRFMKSLEASPFIQNVQLTRSDLVQAEGKEVTEFLLEAETQSPPPFVIKTVPLVVSAVR
ncbi:MAG TPA: PilN domain-containing protein [Gemmatimonadaceae bacterium]|jgi:Tfp pilus assembly protein PilN|nr:PilN domain-containing protein [Gemmatimonadaceae bacterium]